MAIKQQLQYNDKTDSFIGYTNLGLGNECHEASEVFVFLLEGLKQRWKAPIAFFFTNTLHGETQAQLIKMAQTSVEQIGMTIKSIITNGHTANKATAKELGAHLGENMSNYCTTPHGKTYIIFDTCHMIKLARNALHDYNKLRDKTGKLITWEYLQI